MNKGARIALTLFVILVCTGMLTPTFWYYVVVPRDIKIMASSTNEEIRSYTQSYASNRVSELTAKALSNGSEKISGGDKYLISDAKRSLSERRLSTPDKWTYYSLLSSFANEGELFSAVENHMRKKIQNTKTLSNFILNLGLDLRGGMSVLLEADVDGYEEKTGERPSQSELSALLNEDIQILNSRIDQYGVTEPQIRQEGGDRILIEIPGEADSERVNSFIRSRGSLTFQLVDQELTNRVNRLYSTNPSQLIAPDGSIIPQSYIPEGMSLMGYYLNDAYGLEYLDSFAVLYDEVAIDGSHLRRAETSRDQQTNRPVVNFSFDTEGGSIFREFTSRNVGRPLAVVMDGKVKSIATINSVISQDVQLTGGFTEEEAESLAVTLKTSSLPIDLKVVSLESVGASLGDDAIKMALYALLLGIFLVLAFMIIYYGPSGIVADIALLMNLYIMLSLLSVLNFTLTLASIAGIVLTLGMAIDSNVIIYERMKEEIRGGAIGYMAVKAGFKRAFWTIMDSNVTTIIAAVVLSIFGSSTVKGFANTLAIGIAASLFTSLFVTHLIYDMTISEEKMNRVRLSWRRKAL